MPNIDAMLLHREIINQLQRYSRQVEEEVEELSKETAKALVQELKRTSPKKSGDYKKGWRSKKVGRKYVVFNKTEYRLTHLLEHGHAKRGGGRVEAKVHIAPAEERAISTFLSEVERVIRP